MLSDYQTRVLEGLNARIGDLIGAVRQLTEAVRQLPAAPPVSTRPPEAPETATSAHLAAWDEVEATLRRLQALERCHTAFGRAPTDDLAESPPIAQARAGSGAAVRRRRGCVLAVSSHVATGRPVR